MLLLHFSCICERSVVTIASLGIRLSAHEKEILTAIAHRTDTTISQILRKLIREYITTFEKENLYE